jgi:acid phosphatase type 7
VTPLWQALYEYGADLVISAHDHLYERFAPRAPNGALDPANGIRQISAGIGGARLYAINTISPYTEAINNDTHGVLKLVLENAYVGIHTGGGEELYRFRTAGLLLTTGRRVEAGRR